MSTRIVQKVHIHIFHWLRFALMSGRFKLGYCQ